jgi:hypothetical protein
MEMWGERAKQARRFGVSPLWQAGFEEVAEVA